MAERICFDPTKESSANAPLELISADDDQVSGITAHAYPAPPQQIQWAGSVDTDGELPASRKDGNRQITLTVEIADPGLAAATNKATNPKAAVDTTGWTNNSLVLMERQTTLPARLDPFDTAIHATGNADDDSASLSAAVTNGVAETFTAWVYVVSGTVRLEVWTAGPANFASSSNITVGSWQKVALPYTPNATATWTFRVCQNGAGTSEFYVAGAQIGPAYPYFDGDTLGCSWSGTRSASSSTRPAGEARFNAAVADVQAKVAKVAREGGTLRRVLNDGTPITFDLHSRDTFDITFDVAYQAGLAVIQIGLTGKSAGRGDPITLSVHTETTLPALVFTETGIKGDCYALGTLAVNNDQAATGQKGLIWGLESRSTSTGIPLFIEAEETTYGAYSPPLGGTLATGTGVVSGGGSNNVIRRTSAGGPSYASMLYKRFSSLGIFNIYARVYCPTANTGTANIRMRWGNIGSGALTAEPYVTLDPSWEGTWRIVLLGQAYARPQYATPTAGDWGFIFDVIQPTAGDVLDIDCFFVVPVAEGSGVIDSTNSPIETVGPVGDFVISHNTVQRYGTSSETLIAGYDRPQKYEGDYLLIPPAGAEGRTLRMIVKLSRGAITTAADSDIDDLSAQLTYIPRYLVVPSP